MIPISDPASSMALPQISPQHDEVLTHTSDESCRVRPRTTRQLARRRLQRPLLEIPEAPDYRLFACVCVTEAGLGEDSP